MTKKTGSQSGLPTELKKLVHWAVSQLGVAIKKHYGTKRYQQVEKLREKMKDVRGLSDEESSKILWREYGKIKNLSENDLFELAHSYSLMLELINRCESAYRTWRLESRESKNFNKSPYAIHFVLTAHPTEARSPESLQIFGMIQNLLIQSLHKDKKSVEAELLSLLQISLQVPMARDHKPTVEDEAMHIFSFALRKDILDQLIEFHLKDQTVLLRTWVGGDKDGHPGVNEKVMMNVLDLSRNHLLGYLTKMTKKIEKYLTPAKETEGTFQSLFLDLERIKLHLNTLTQILPNDGKKVVELRKLIEDFSKNFEKATGVKIAPIKRMEGLMWIFPALVLPLELREDRLEVADAITNKSQPIRKMLEKICSISKGYEPKWYARGLILSMTESATHIRGGIKLVKDVFGDLTLPVVPLFENQLALETCKSILEELFSKEKSLASKHKKLYGARYEVMLGYSDSSKESGVLSSKLMIAKGMRTIESQVKKQGLETVFFHGSGGSVERGGGSIKEQTQWWPKSALNNYKATIQGEMVARTFSTGQIMRSQTEKIMQQLLEVKNKKSDYPLLHKFANAVRDQYQERVRDDEFLRMVSIATPYTFLDQLKIGSRPSKRKSGDLNLNSLRAIPWILCWTQTRSLFPTWFGVGTAFENLTDAEKKELQTLYGSSDVFSSFVKLLAFTMSKVELSVFQLYLYNSSLSKAEVEKYTQMFQTEKKRTIKFIKSVTGQKSLLWFRPWLHESIRLRSPMIHPLNLFQLAALENQSAKLLRETVTGIASGMLTTG
jgi:phosphoenolpyruvate carboxylase